MNISKKVLIFSTLISFGCISISAMDNEALEQNQFYSAKYPLSESSRKTLRDRLSYLQSLEMKLQNHCKEALVDPKFKLIVPDGHMALKGGDNTVKLQLTNEAEGNINQFIGEYEKCASFELQDNGLSNDEKEYFKTIWRIVHDHSLAGCKHILNAMYEDVSEVMGNISGESDENPFQEIELDDSKFYLQVAREAYYDDNLRERIRQHTNNVSRAYRH